MSDIRLVCGECSEVMRGMPCDSVDLILTSPPYDQLREYHGYAFDFPAIAAQLYRVLKPGGVIVWVVGDQTKDGSESGTSFRQALHFMSLGLNLHDTMIYEAAGTGAKGSRLSYWQGFEYMFVLSKSKPKTINLLRDRPNTKRPGTIQSTRRRREGGEMRVPEYFEVSLLGNRTNIWRYATGHGHSFCENHPAPFPEALARDHILSWSNPGDLVLDPFVGSGTTAKQCVLLERNCIGIDISTEYIALAQRRVEQAQMQIRMPL